MGNAERFSGKVAVVTGASSGIGAAVASRLRDEGARVASFDLDAEAPEGVLSLEGDVSRSADVDRAVADAQRELGPIDVLVCSAGVPGASLATVDVTDEEWRRVLLPAIEGEKRPTIGPSVGIVDVGEQARRTADRVCHLGIGCAFAGVRAGPMQQTGDVIVV